MSETATSSSSPLSSPSSALSSRSSSRVHRTWPMDVAETAKTVRFVGARLDAVGRGSPPIPVLPRLPPCFCSESPSLSRRRFSPRERRRLCLCFFPSSTMPKTRLSPSLPIGDDRRSAGAPGCRLERRTAARKIAVSAAADATADDVLLRLHLLLHGPATSIRARPMRIVRRLA